MVEIVAFLIWMRTAQYEDACRENVFFIIVGKFLSDIVLQAGEYVLDLLLLLFFFYFLCKIRVILFVECDT